ncbi:helix-turn-helix domain-containing protein [Chondromyces crocatus]|uniref:AraC family transcriptional regulator n=1 Tax=Chondromyces crocatus TaxID=52 RepID=A0A0K1EKQ2_CHOCO|nr:helix-turn-helix domain-containing protein [Chondromyces crocatus]AKT41464.1 AraC family transcriptional regulator [Chondromyces crocatus]
MTTTTTDATPSFSRFIEAVRALGPTDTQYDWLPDGRTTLVFRVLDRGRLGDVCIAGPQTRAHFKNLSGVTRAAAIRFKPGWTVPLVGIPASEVTDRIVPLDDIWGRAGTELYAELLATRDLPQLIQCVSRAFTRRLSQTVEPSSARIARRAARLIEDGEGRVERVAQQLGVTARHLRRAFTENIGVAPKEFARTVRLQRAIRMSANSNDWSRIATDAGYYDQAHLIGDYREFLGVTPTALSKRERGATLEFA